MGPVPAPTRTAADHLTAFLDATPLSDRVLAGESPARFRRRLVLERAAYLMVSTDRTLLDLALDSGFSGQASFANAFRGEFGVLPSVWRADPTTYVIDAPGDVHLHPPAGLRLPARHRMDGTDLVVAMAEHHVRLVERLVDLAQGVADEQQALDRLVAEMERVSAAARDEHEAVPFEEPETVRARLDRVGPAFVADVARLAATGRFDETFVEAFSPTPHAVSYGAMVADVLTGGDHHRMLDRLQRHVLGADHLEPG